MDSGSPRSRIPDPDPEYPIPGILDQDARNELKNNMMPLNIYLFFENKLIETSTIEYNITDHNDE